MGKLEIALQMLLDVFECYARRDGDKLRLNRREMRSVYQGELGHLLTASRDPERVGEILAELDKNADGEVSFEEFTSLVTKLFQCSSTYFEKFGGQSFCGVR